TQQPVQVGLIGRKYDVEFRVLQLQPCQVAGEVIVAEQGIGSQFKKLRERGIIAELGRCPQSVGRWLQKSAKGNVVRNSLKFSLIPAHDRELIVNRRFLLRMLLDVLLHLVARQIRGIEPCAQRHGVGSDKWLILIQKIEARSVDPEVSSQLDIAPVPA